MDHRDRHLAARIQSFVDGLKSADDPRRGRATREMHRYVTTELLERPAEEIYAFTDGFTAEIFKLLLESVESNEKRAGVLAILNLIDVDVANHNVPKYANYLRNLTPLDPQLMELVACACGRIARSSGNTMGPSYVDFEVRRALEALTVSSSSSGGSTASAAAESNRVTDLKRLPAIMVLRELANSAENHFAPHVKNVLDTLASLMREPARQPIREAAVDALRATLAVIAARETKEATSSTLFKACYDEALRAIDQAATLPPKATELRDNQLYGALVILNELMRCANMEAEQIRQSLETEDPTLFSGDYLLPAGGSGGGTGSQSGNALGWASIFRDWGPGSISKGLRALHQQRYSLGNTKLSAVVQHHRDSGAAPGLVNRPRPAALYESKTCRLLIEEKFTEICDLIMTNQRMLATRPVVAGTVQLNPVVISLLSRLAAFNPSGFTAGYLKRTIAHLVGCIKINRDRTLSYTAIGLIALAVGRDILAELSENKVFDLMRTHLPPLKDINVSAHASGATLTPSQKKRGATQMINNFEPAVFTCLGLLAVAMGDEMAGEFKKLLDPMINTGLSRPLTTALQKLNFNVPSLRRDIQPRLIKVLCEVLLRQPYKHPGAPPVMSPVSGFQGAVGTNASISTATTATSPHHTYGPFSSLITSSPSTVTLQNAQLAENKPSTKTIVLALQTLGQFEFQNRIVINFVQNCADIYLEHEDRDVRLEAVKMCAKLLRSAIESYHSITNTINTIVSEVVRRLLVVGVTDRDEEVRYTVMENLDDKFDAYLAQPANLASLFTVLNDEVFEIRELVICTIGRLSNINPAYVMPPLRKVLIQLVTELEFAGIGRNKEQAAKMLGHLISNAPRLIRPYTEPIIRVFIAKLREADPNPSVAISVLHAIGEQGRVSDSELAKWVDKIFPIILQVIQDSSAKREVGLWTMGHLIECSGYVVTPYFYYPNLLDLLLNYLRFEQNTTIRREAIRNLGLLGAIDPYKHKVSLGIIDHQGGLLMPINDPTHDGQEMSGAEMLVECHGQLDEFYPKIVIQTLMRVLRDPSLVQHHALVVQAVIFNFTFLGVRCVPYLAQVLPPFIAVIRTCDGNIREFLFQQLGVLISIVKQHIRSYLEDIFKLIKEFWTVNTPMHCTLITLVDQIVIALGGEFKAFLPPLIPHVLKIFALDQTANNDTTLRLLSAMQHFGTNLDGYLHLLIPPVVRLFDSSEAPIKIRLQALKTIDVFSESLDLTEYASHIIHPLVRVLDRDPELRAEAMNTLTALVYQLNKRYAMFIPMVHKILKRHAIVHERYEILATRIIRDVNGAVGAAGAATLGPATGPAGPPMGAMGGAAGTATGGTRTENGGDDGAAGKRGRLRGQTPGGGGGGGGPGGGGGGPAGGGSAQYEAAERKHGLSIYDLERSSHLRRNTREEWIEWVRMFSIDLVSVSPSLSIKSCSPLAQAYTQLPRELFNAAFLSCWTELVPKDRQLLIDMLEHALNESNVTEVMQAILNLAEFMEHQHDSNLALWLDRRLLAAAAIRCRAFAKALHFYEEEFHKSPTTDILEQLILTNTKLQHSEAATGVLKYAKENQLHLKVKERWYEKLHDWDTALREYRKTHEANPDDLNCITGEMRCLEELGHWTTLFERAKENWGRFDDDTAQKTARVAAVAAWELNAWDEMRHYVRHMKRDSADDSFYNAVLCIQEEDYPRAQILIDKARDVIEADLIGMAAESYNRAYPAMVQVMMLAELEEVIQYKLIPERRDLIKNKWWTRLQGCTRVVGDWQRILQVRSLVLLPQDDIRAWLKFASLCQHSKRFQQSDDIIQRLLSADRIAPVYQSSAGGGRGGFMPSMSGNGIGHVEFQHPLTSQLGCDPRVKFAHLKHLWKRNAAHDRERAFNELQSFVELVDSAQHRVAGSVQYVATAAAAGQGSVVGVAPGFQPRSLPPGAQVPPQVLAPGATAPAGGPGSGTGGMMVMGDETAIRLIQFDGLLSRCYLKLGQWQEALKGIQEDTIPNILQYYSCATERDRESYKAWHSWAYMNYEAVLFYKRQLMAEITEAAKATPGGSGLNVPEGHPVGKLTGMGTISPNLKSGNDIHTATAYQRAYANQTSANRLYITAHAVPAVKGFFRSISLSHGNSLQDTLRLLTLWFEDGQQKEVYEVLEEGWRSVPVETWLQVIPQLIARIDTPRVLVRKLIHVLLEDIGMKHPQALIYPLTVATKSQATTRVEAANKILINMREHSAVLVEQAMLISEELIRVSILWMEQWHEGLEEASRLYFGDKNVRGMFERLWPLHEMMAHGAQTLKEVSFCQAYGRDLAEALECCNRFKRNNNLKELTQAWDLYYHVFRRISKQLPSLTTLELQYVSPKLMGCQDLELAVPGSYAPNKPIICISMCHSTLPVITSKQRPRKLTIRGSDGRDYMYLLKGHEDLRQDERVMQLFGLVNTLLVNDPETSRRNLAIQRYAVIPLSPNSGLIGWVPNCDTLHSLIKDFRERKQIMLNIEHRIMLRMAPDYDHLTLMQKVEVFEHALCHTKGDDLARLLWLKSPSSEVWFERRTNYTRSLAVMSMVGYILGLGDRHPSNLMLDRMNGKILHIDFGDCFEVAMTREKFPEKIPFRLTRMLINAMEVTGIEGTYRVTCENVMRVLRKNKDSLMSVLEAFVYDPLLNWRLVEATTNKVTRSERSQSGTSIAMGGTPNPENSSAANDPLGGGVSGGAAGGPAGAAGGGGGGAVGGGDGAGGGVGPAGDHVGRIPKRPRDHHTSSGQAADVGAAAAAAGVMPDYVPEARNKKAVAVVNRVRDKLTGRDFDSNLCLSVPAQVDLLIKQATSNENLCQCYIGWCPFW